MAAGQDGRREAARRQRRPEPGDIHTANGGGGPVSNAASQAPAGERATREWTLEHLLANPGLRGIAHADERFHGNRTARRACADLARAVAQVEAEHKNVHTPDDAA